MGPQTDAAMLRKVVWASTIGNALEWFDFTVFGLFAPTIGKQFFPKGDATAGLLAAYGLLGVAYFARPIGGIAFGVWADRVGRKRAMITVVLSMAVGTAAIGLVPTYATIGVWAPILMLVARLIQGFSAGGNFGASTAMLIEFAPPGKKAFYGSFQFVAQWLAFVIGAGFAYLINVTLSPDAVNDWAWRIPFLFGIVIAPVGFYLRSQIDETPEFKAFLVERAGIPNTPLRDALTHFPRPIIALFLMIAGFTCNVYIGNIFMTNFAAVELKLKLSDAQLGILVVNLISAILLPWASSIGDKIGRVRVMVIAIIVFTVIYPILGYALISEPSTARLWAMQAVGLIFIFVAGPFAALSVEAFPVNVRSTGASIMYNVGVAVFGGLSPLITSALARGTGSPFSPFIYLIGCMVISLIGLALLPKQRL